MVETMRSASYKSDDGSARRKIIAGCFLIFAFCSLCVTAEGHDPGLSAASVGLYDEQITIRMTFARPDIESLVAVDADRDGRITEQELDRSRPQLEALASGALEILIDDKGAFAKEASVEIDESDAIHFRIIFQRVRGERLIARSSIISKLARGHRQYVSIKDADGRLVDERMLDAGNNMIEASLAQETRSTTDFYSFTRFLVLGVEHILTGYDHLVFLIGLLIAGASLTEAAKIITSFTLAHSLTLALSTLDVVNLSPAIVEPLIAASIVYVGIENILRRDVKRRWLLTFAFGLAHGFGFASALKELEIARNASRAAVPLLSFNIGVELGQIAIAAAMLPLIWKLKERSVFITRYAPACSLLIALAGVYWLVERTL